MTNWHFFSCPSIIPRTINNGMLKNYFKIAWRNLQKGKSYSLINVVGLSVGIAVSMLIGLWIYDELSFNRSFDHYDRIAIVIRQFNYNSQRINLPGSPYAMRDEYLSKYPQDFKSVVLSTPGGDHMLVSDNKNYLKPGSFMDPEAAGMFSLHMLEGTRAGLRQPAGILLSRSLAATIFGDADPLGKTIRIDGNSNARVTGVYEDLPYNSDLKDLSFIASMELYLAANPDIKMARNPWLEQDRFNCYVELTDQADMDRASVKIRDIRHGKLPLAYYKVEEMIDYLHPMSKWHLYSNFESYTGYAVREKIEYVRLLCFIGFFVLLLACINFINLSTARSEKRAKEVGIRKVIGSVRAQLVGQFLFESLLPVSFAFILSLIWVNLVLPSFDKIAAKQLALPWASFIFWAGSIGFILLTGLLSGLYPAFYLSSFQPVKVLKGTFRAGRLATLPRKVLVVFQFTVSVALIVCTMVIYRQIQYAFNRPIGYDRNGLVMINMTPDIRKNYTIIGDELKRSGAIMEMAASQNTTVDYNVDDNKLNWDGKDPNANVDWAVSKVTYDYGKTIGWQIIEGRDFSPAFPTDSSGLILNEAAVKQIGFQHPIAKTVEWRGRPFHVIGVIRNIVFESPYMQASSPSVFHMTEGDNYVVTLKLNPRLSAREALARVQSVFTRYNPTYTFDYRFVDQEYARKFSEEAQIGKLSGFFTVLAVFISCLGLFGMVSFMAEQRKKEISVRKVLGASEFDLWRMLSKDYVVLVGISLLVASPIAYYLMHGWLQQYEYRYQMSWVVFVVAGSGALLVALLTVSYQAVKAARANPVKGLRAE